jgi:hypothetical protein
MIFSQSFEIGQLQWRGAWGVDLSRSNTGTLGFCHSRGLRLSVLANPPSKETYRMSMKASKSRRKSVPEG